jgi:hypothetical protein
LPSGDLAQAGQGWQGFAREFFQHFGKELVAQFRQHARTFPKGVYDEPERKTDAGDIGHSLPKAALFTVPIPGTCLSMTKSIFGINGKSQCSFPGRAIFRGVIWK